MYIDNNFPNQEGTCYEHQSVFNSIYWFFNFLKDGLSSRQNFERVDFLGEKPAQKNRGKIRQNHNINFN